MKVTIHITASMRRIAPGRPGRFQLTPKERERQRRHERNVPCQNMA